MTTMSNELHCDPNRDPVISFPLFCHTCGRHYNIPLTRELTQIVCPAGHSLHTWRYGGWTKLACGMCHQCFITHFRVREEGGGAWKAPLSSGEMVAHFAEEHPEVFSALPPEMRGLTPDTVPGEGKA